MFWIRKGAIKYKNWKVSSICLKQLQKNHELDCVLSVDIYYLRTPQPAPYVTQPVRRDDVENG
jgi:hypothetical protein